MTLSEIYRGSGDVTVSDNVMHKLLITDEVATSGV